MDLAEKISQYLKSNNKPLIIIEDEVPDMKLLFSYIECLDQMEYQVHRLNQVSSIHGPLQEPIGLFWMLKDAKGNQAYLLGSQHIVPHHLLDLNSKIRDCFQQSQALAVEIDVTREDVDEHSARECMAEKLKIISSLSKEEMTKVFEILSKQFPDLAQQAKPHELSQEQFIFVALQVLSSQVLKKMSLSLSLGGIDLELIRQAKVRGLAVDDLETREFREKEKSATSESATEKNDLSLGKTILKLIKELPSEENFAEALKILEQDMIYVFEKIAIENGELWEQGDLSKIDSSSTYSISKRKRMETRNLNMAKRMDELIQTGKRYFFVAGSAHTVGKMCIQDFLESFGWTATRVL